MDSDGNRSRPAASECSRRAKVNGSGGGRRRAVNGGRYLPIGAALENLQALQSLLDGLHPPGALGMAGEAVAWRRLYRVHEPRHLISTGSCLPVG